MPNNLHPLISFDTLPGHYIRRLQQIAVATFLQETQAFGITPIQYATLGGQALFNEASPVVIAAQSRILAPLPESQHAQFMQMLQTLVSGNNELSRAPTR